MDQSAVQLQNVEFNEDVSTNPRNKPVLSTSSSKGGWKACYFILACNFGERMGYYGIVSNLVVYMGSTLQEGSLTATKNINNLAGTTWIVPIFAAYIADTYLGRFWTFCAFSIIYVLGMILLVMSVTVDSLKQDPCKGGGQCDKVSTIQTVMFFVALYAVGVAAGSIRPNISNIGADQFDELEEKEKLQKASFFNWWMVSIFLASLIGQTLSVYIQENVGYGWGYGVLAVGYVISLLLFFMGTPFYRHQSASKENQYKLMAQVFVAALRRWRVPLPSESSHFHELDPDGGSSTRRPSLARTPILRFLDKAAIKEGSARGPWRLCTVTQVEETKLVIKLIPVLLTLVTPSIIVSQVNTLFVKQASTLNRKIGPRWEIPAGSLTALVTISMMLTVVLYDRFAIKYLEKITGNPKGFTVLQRMGTGYALQVIAMAVASVVDAKRANMIKKLGLANKGAETTLPLSVFILAPQFVVTGIATAHFQPALMEFFNVESPRNMKSTSTAFVFVTNGIAFYLSSFLLTIVNDVTSTNGEESGWIQNNLNSSRLYCYYALLAVLGSVNLLLFVVFSRLHTYRSQNQPE